MEEVTNSCCTQTKAKKTLGRRKIEIKRIEKKNRRLVTFSKRRKGLFNKAEELAVLCGAEIAVIVLSPTDKIHSFGGPSVDSVLDRFAGEEKEEEKFWWEEVDVKRMGLEELERYKAALKEMRDDLRARHQKIDVQENDFLGIKSS